MEWYVIAVSMAACGWCGWCVAYCLHLLRAVRKEVQMAAYMCEQAGESASAAQTAAKRVEAVAPAFGPAYTVTQYKQSVAEEIIAGLTQYAEHLEATTTFAPDPTLPAGVPFAFDPSQVQPESQA